jgi:hypothetical protein
MFDASRYVPCGVTEGALAALAARDGMSDIDVAESFARFHLEIEAIASAKYDRGELNRYEVIVGDADVPKETAPNC